MQSTRSCISALAWLVLTATASEQASAQAESWPSRPVTLIVPFPAGGATDTVGRLTAKGLGDRLGQGFVVENRGGGAGGIGAAAVARSQPDGYTLLLATSSTQAVIPVTTKQSYDPLRELVPVGMLARAPNLLIVSPKIPGKGVQDLVSFVKNAGGKANFASSGPGSITHLVALLFNSMAGIQAAHVPYKAGVQAVPDLKSGEISYQFDSIIWALPLVRAGEIHAFGIASPKRSALAPDIPTVSEQGLAGFEGDTWFALASPSGVPAPIMARLAAELAGFLDDADTKTRFAAVGAEPWRLDAQAVINLTRQEQSKWRKLVEAAGITQQ